MNKPHTFPQPTAATFNVADLVERVRQGRIRIPKFQRPLRWKWEDARRLFDSISKGYPVGSLLLWKREGPKETVEIGPMRIPAPAFSDCFWVVDGQQRITALASALSDEGLGSEDFALAYDLDKVEFVHVPKTERPHVIPLPVLFDLQRLVQWAQTYPEIAKRLPEASAITTAIRQYAIPASIVEQQEEEVLRDIFDRMNNYGKRLSRAEVFGALHPGVQGSDGQGWFERIINEIEGDLFFGRCDDDTVLRAVLARRGPDVTREIRDEFGDARKNRDFGDESEDIAYREGGEALKRAVVFLQEIGVIHLAFLPYKYLLIVLSRFFSHFPNPAPRNRELLRRWFWRASLIGPNVYSGSWNHAMRTLAGCISKDEENESVQRLLGEVNKQSDQMRFPDLKAFRPNQANSRVALCALWRLGPRSPLTHSAYTRQQLSEAIGENNSLLPVLRTFLPRVPIDARPWLANRLFFVADEPTSPTKELMEKPLAEAAAEKWRDTLKSHAVSDEMMFLIRESGDDYVQRVLILRHELLVDIVRNFIAVSAEWDFEDTPPLNSLDLDDEDWPEDSGDEG